MNDLITEARELCELRRKQKHIPMTMLDKALELCDALEEALTELDRLTEAQRWIPVAEKLPADGRFLCAYKVASLGTCMSILNYAAQLESVDKYKFEGYARGGFYTYDNEYGDFEWTGVTHWRELPEPPEEGAEK